MWKVIQAITGHQKALVSPVPHLQTSNVPPNEEETQLIHHAIETAMSQLKVHRAELRLQSLWAPSTAPKPVPPAEIAELEGRICQLRSLTSSMRQFPPELLRIVFTMGTQPRPPAPELHCPKSVSDWPWTVSQVCQRWRYTALSTPLLWSYLPPIKLQESDSSRKVRRCYCLLKVMIQRSHNAGIHIFINGTKGLTNHSKISDLLVKHAERWESVSLSISGTQLYTLRGIQNRIPRLRRLSIRLSPASRNDILVFNMFSNAPSLIDVEFCTLTGQLKFPESQLSKLALQTSGLKNLMPQSISTNAVCLEDLKLSNVSLPQFNTPVLLPNLKRLCLKFSAVEDLYGLNQITTPMLEGFYIGGSHPDILPVTLALFQRSFQGSIAVCPLQILVITQEVDITESKAETLVSILELTPGLRSLECPIPSTNALMRLAGEQPLAPLLECLQFTIIFDITHATCRGVNAIAASRCEIEDADDDVALLQATTALRCFVIKPGYGGTVLNNEMKQCQIALEESWGGLPKTTQIPSVANTMEEEVQNDSPQVAVMLEMLQDSVRGLLPGETRYYGDPISENPSSELHVSRKQVEALTSNITLCRKRGITAQDIATSRMVGFEFVNLKRRVNGTPDKIKKEMPHIEDLGRCLKELLEEWMFTIDEQLSSIHWIHDTRQRLYYIPQWDPLRKTNQGLNMVLDLEFLLSLRFRRYEKIMENFHLSSTQLDVSDPMKRRARIRLWFPV